jgi:hypothetical protein
MRLYLLHARPEFTNARMQVVPCRAFRLRRPGTNRHSNRITCAAVNTPEGFIPGVPVRGATRRCSKNRSVSFSENLIDLPILKNGNFDNSPVPEEMAL